MVLMSCKPEAFFHIHTACFDKFMLELFVSSHWTILFVQSGWFYVFILDVFICFYWMFYVFILNFSSFCTGCFYLFTLDAFMNS